MKWRWGLLYNLCYKLYATYIINMYKEKVCWFFSGKFQIQIQRTWQWHRMICICILLCNKMMWQINPGDNSCTVWYRIELLDKTIELGRTFVSNKLLCRKGILFKYVLKLNVSLLFSNVIHTIMYCFWLLRSLTGVI